MGRGGLKTTMNGIELKKWGLRWDQGDNWTKISERGAWQRRKSSITKCKAYTGEI